jgi:aldehyde:ferredoxin oxidoreductase
VEVGFELDWYPRYLKAATGLTLTMEDLYPVADRIYSLARAFWVREFGQNWSSNMDMVPNRWFTEPLTKGPFKSAKLDKSKYEAMLQMYYKKRGWDNRGIPTKSTLDKLGLSDVTQELSQQIQLAA